MQIGPVTLDGHHVRLEPVSLAHVPDLWRAAEPEEIRRYLSSTVRSEEEMRSYVASELAKQQAGLVVRFATVAKAIAQPVGSTSYLNIDRHHASLVSRRARGGVRDQRRLRTLCTPPRSSSPRSCCGPGRHPSTARQPPSIAPTPHRPAPQRIVL